MDEPDVSGAGDAQKPQFRTYASDVAKLTGSNTPLPKHASVSSMPQQATPISMPVAPAPAPAPVPKTPHEPPPAEIIPKAPSTDETREAVLARLRAKVGAPAPTPPPATIIPKAPSTDEAREEVLARLKAKSATPASAPAIAPAQAVPPLPRYQPPAPPPGIPPINRLATPAAPAPIHTYKTDFSEEAREKGASRISILAAQADAQGRTAATPELRTKKKNHSLLIAGAVLLILAGGASIYAAVSFVTGHPPIVIGPSVPSLIFADDRVELKGESFELRRGLADLSEHSLPQGGVVIAYITYSTTTEKGKTVTLPAEGGALIRSMDLPAPEILLRNIEPSSTVGAVRAGEETRPFFIFRVASFERTFAGMLEWERGMMNDLTLFYPLHPEIVRETFGTSTEPTQPAPIAFDPFFADEVVDNHDVRVLRDGAGRAILLYGYRDKETLIIARDEAAFSELLARLASTRAD